jgi:cell division GTPase FtsZ
MALHHPMLDEISLDTASGIIANFSGSEDLKFTEVAEAMSRLNQESGNKAEIIPGFINDHNLQDRCQVILIVTGLGALPIEQAIPGAEKIFNKLNKTEYEEQPQKTPEKSKFNKPFHQDELEDTQEYAVSLEQSRIMANDLDVPAFLRKRIRG